MLLKYVQTKTKNKFLKLSVLIACSSYQSKCKNYIQLSPLQNQKTLS